MITKLAILTQALPSAGKEFRILPAGIFRAKDGRPSGIPGWKMDATIAARLIANTANGDDLSIDYEHQTILAHTNGQPAPAAGWFRQMVWREGQGLFAVDVKWTDKAKAMIAAGEYRYISPVFNYSAVTGEVTRLAGLGLTNNPALMGLTDLSQVALSASLAVRGQSATRPRESDRGIEAVNQLAGHLGVFHPDTSPESIAAMLGNTPKPVLLPSIVASDPRGAEAIRRLCPEAWQK